jgi:hypothetical protein
MTWTPPDSLASLFSRLAARRKDTLAVRARDRHNEAEQLSARGMGSGGLMAKAIRDVYVSEFRAYGEGVTQDVIELVQNPNGSLEPEAAEWIRERLESNLDTTARGIKNALQNEAHKAGVDRAPTSRLTKRLRASDVISVSVWTRQR